jgi:hypothetical protein
MPENYYRIDLRLTPELSESLEKMRQELYQQTGKKLSKGHLVREMVREFLESPSRSCFSPTRDINTK